MRRTEQQLALLLPVSPSMRRYEGYVRAGDRDYGVAVEVEGEAGKKSLFRISPSPALAALLEGLEPALLRIAATCRDPSELATELAELAEAAAVRTLLVLLFLADVASRRLSTSGSVPSVVVGGRCGAPPSMSGCWPSSRTRPWRWLA